jgi:hypothetical protein
MSRKDFYISTDTDGNMPVLSAKPIVTKPAWIKYINDRPVAVKPYQGQTQVWDYAACEFLALSPSAKTYAGKPMQQYKGEIL